VLAADGSFAYTPEPGFTGTDVFRYSLVPPTPTAGFARSAGAAGSGVVADVRIVVSGPSCAQPPAAAVCSGTLPRTR
jgi:hypothetical protein